MADEIDVGAQIPTPDTAAPDSVDQTTNTPATETEAPAVESQEAEKAPEPNLDDELDAAWNKAQGEGDEEKPAEAQDAAPEGEVSEDQAPDGEAEKPEQAETSAIEPPSSWSKEVKEHWSKIPPETQRYIAQREAQAHQAISQMGQQVKAAEPILNLVNQNRDLFEGRGVAADQGINELIAAQRFLQNDPISAIQWLAESSGVDLSMFANGDGSDSSQNPLVESLQYRLDQQTHQIEQLNRLVQSREEREAQANLQTVASETDSFIEQHKIDDALADAMAPRVQFYSTMHPEMPVRERLAKAYEETVWTNPDLRQAKLNAEAEAKKAQEAAEAAQRVKQAKLAGSVNVKSTPINTQSNVSIDDALEAKWNELRAS